MVKKTLVLPLGRHNILLFSLDKFARHPFTTGERALSDINIYVDIAFCASASFAYEYSAL